MAAGECVAKRRRERARVFALDRIEASPARRRRSTRRSSPPSAASSPSPSALSAFSPPLPSFGKRAARIAVPFAFTSRAPCWLRRYDTRCDNRRALRYQQRRTCRRCSRFVGDRQLAVGRHRVRRDLEAVPRCAALRSSVNCAETSFGTFPEIDLEYAGAGPGDRHAFASDLRRCGRPRLTRSVEPEREVNSFALVASPG